MNKTTKLLMVLLSAQLIGQANATIANVAAPAIKEGLHTGSATTELMIGAYLITFAVLIITGARLGYLYGYKKLFLIGMGIFGTSSFLCGIAPNIELLIAGRALQGVGMALAFPQTLTGIHLAFSGSERIRAMGLYSIALAAGAIVGQILGGVLIAINIANTSWRPIFWLYVPICAAVIWAAATFLPQDKSRAPGRPDLMGVSLLSLGIVAIILPLTLGREMGWPLWAWGALLASLPILWLFVYIQKRKEQSSSTTPLVAVSAIARPTILWGLAGILLATCTYYAFIFVFALYSQDYLNNNALFTAAILTPWAIGFAFSGQIVRRIPSRIGRALPLLSYGLFALMFVGTSFVQVEGLFSQLFLATLFILSGVGQGAGFISIMGFMTASVSKRYAADLSGVVTTVIELSGALGVALFGGIYAIFTNSLSPRVAFFIVCLALAFTTLLAAAAVYAATLPTKITKTYKKNRSS